MVHQHDLNIELYGFMMIQYDSCGVSEFLASSNFDKFARPPLLGQMASDKFNLLPSTHGQRSISNYSIQKTCIKFIFHVTSCQRKNGKTEKTNISSIK